MNDEKTTNQINEPLSDPIWIEVEVHEDDDGLNCYSGLANKELIDKIVSGSVERDRTFLRLDHVFWTKTKKETEWGSATREVVEYGKGGNGNYKGSIYIRVDRIFLLSPLNGGAELQRRYIKQ